MRPLAIFQRKVAKPKGRGRAARRKVDPLRRHRQRQAAALMVVSFAAIVGAWYIWSSGVIGRTADAMGAAFERQVAAAGLSVDQVLVAGRKEVTREQVLAALGVKSGEVIFNLDPQAARNRLIGLGWVKLATVERRLPNTVIVELQEREPLALWQREGRHHLIDRDGVVITQKDLGRFAALPVVIGPDAPEATATLIDMLKQQPTLFADVEAAVRVGGRRWNLRLKNGIDVNLPETQAGEAWGRLATLAREQRILERDVMAIDMRVPDHFVVRMTPPAAERRRNPGKDT